MLDDNPVRDIALTQAADEADAIRSHPELPAAVRQLFVVVTRQQAEVGRRRFLIGDKARRLAFWTAMSLDAERVAGRSWGLTVNRFCDLLTAHGEMSRGRARAIFLFMRHAGFIKRLGGAEPGKPVVYVPSERMIGLSAARLSAGFEALGKVSRIGAEGLHLVEDPAFITAFFHCAREEIASGMRPLDGAVALSPFIGRDCGEYVAMHLYLAHVEAPAAERAAGVLFNITKVAALTHVSRAHVSALIRDAAQAGLLERSQDRMRLSPVFETAVMDSLTAVFLQMEKITAAAIETLSQRRNSGGPSRG
ncbi:hypothetical protein [Acuticoccus mangrovi]|uniref:Uncharacterized protein n=1 Tax=Acuticoccus mangrovi TaxID=2796142 RepID=A0A934IQ80_9HYPH|nr:hypothetical protein [Acuticoccus mangrovi]MBJ3776705.1 hypothetical protein [Acuticoccus mangrovi]